MVSKKKKKRMEDGELSYGKVVYQLSILELCCPGGSSVTPRKVTARTVTPRKQGRAAAGIPPPLRSEGGSSPREDGRIFQQRKVKCQEDCRSCRVLGQ